MKNSLLILASTSEPRKQLLQRLQIPFTIVGSDVDETPLANETPEALVQRLAVAKAEAVARQHPNAIIIGADQVGVIDNEIMGKPLTDENAVLQLKKASGKSMKFFIGMALLDSTNNKQEVVLETFDVLYRTLTDADIKHYLQKEQPLQCAGSCKAEGLGIALIEEFRGTDFTALIGLPLIRLCKMLNNFGLNPLSS